MPDKQKKPTNDTSTPVSERSSEILPHDNRAFIEQMSMMTPSTNTSYNSLEPDERNDITLFHELTHAYHCATGTFKNEKVPHNNTTVVEDELATVGLETYANDLITENAYRAARNGLAGGLGARQGDGSIPRREKY